MTCGGVIKAPKQPAKPDTRFSTQEGVSAIVRTRQGEAFGPWMGPVTSIGVKNLMSFTKGLEREGSRKINLYAMPRVELSTETLSRYTTCSGVEH
jgi:hypothetical protein